MTHRNFLPVVSRVAAVAACAALVGCGGDPPPPPPVVSKPVNTAPPPQPLTSIKDLMAQYDIDRRVNLPEDKAPDSDSKRIAVLKFFDAFVRGNGSALRPMLSAPDQLQFDGMVEGGIFAKVTSDITRVYVRCGPNDSSDCALAVFHVGEEFEPQLWVYTTGDVAEFDSVATPPGIMSKLSGDNWIAAWFEILRLELARADEPDAVIEVPQTDFTDEPDVVENETTGISPGGSGGNSPGRRKPTSNPIKPPRPPGFGSR